MRSQNWKLRPSAPASVQIKSGRLVSRKRATSMSRCAGVSPSWKTAICVRVVCSSCFRSFSSRSRSCTKTSAFSFFRCHSCTRAESQSVRASLRRSLAKPATSTGTARRGGSPPRSLRRTALVQGNTASPEETARSNSSNAANASGCKSCSRWKKPRRSAESGVAESRIAWRAFATSGATAASKCSSASRCASSTITRSSSAWRACRASFGSAASSSIEITPNGWMSKTSFPSP